MTLNAKALEAAQTAFRLAEERPEMAPCTRCSGKGYVHGFGEDGRDPDWCPSCGGPGFELAQGEEDRPLREAITAYLSSLPQAGGSEALHNAKILIRALSGPDDAIAQACIAEIEAALSSQQAGPRP